MTTVSEPICDALRALRFDSEQRDAEAAGCAVQALPDLGKLKTLDSAVLVAAGLYRDAFEAEQALMLLGMLTEAAFQARDARVAWSAATSLEGGAR